MSQQVITTPLPSIPRWRGRSIAVIALVALLAAGAGAAVGALLASDSTVTYRSAPTPASEFTPPAHRGDLARQHAPPCGDCGSWRRSRGCLTVTASQTDDR